MNSPRVSVLVPIYKIEDHLPKCIESLLNQSFKDFELILVNDGSPDSCPEICDAYAKKDKRIKVIHKDNGGLLSARKKGLENAASEYIAFVDGDDWVDKFYLDTLINLARVNDADLVETGHFREFDGKIETIKPKLPGIFGEIDIRSSILPNAIYNGEFCEHRISTYVWNKLFRRQILLKVLSDIPNDIIMGEDAAITYSYLALSKSLVVSRIPLYYYRQRHDSIVKSIEDPETEYYRLGLLMKILKTNLKGVLDAENLNQQIRYYLYSQIIIRSGGFIINSTNELIFNPFINLEPNSRAVVYSSGSFGQHILSTNLKANYIKIVKWIDVDFHDFRIGENIVDPISSITNLEFDSLIIATINPSTFNSIRKELLLMGIDEKKIVKINVNPSDIDNLLKLLGFDKNFQFVLNR